MVPQGRGLIVMISSMGGLQYLFNVAYGVGKAAVGYSGCYVYPVRVKTFWELKCLWFVSSVTGWQPTLPLS